MSNVEKAADVINFALPVGSHITEDFGERAAQDLADAGLLSPDLAQEALRLRRELKSMQQTWEPMSTDPARTPIEQDLAALVVATIDLILGDQE